MIWHFGWLSLSLFDHVGWTGGLEPISALTCWRTGVSLWLDGLEHLLTRACRRTWTSLWLTCWRIGGLELLAILTFWLEPLSTWTSWRTGGLETLSMLKCCRTGATLCLAIVENWCLSFLWHVGGLLYNVYEYCIIIIARGWIILLWFLVANRISSNSLSLSLSLLVWNML